MQLLIYITETPALWQKGGLDALISKYLVGRGGEKTLTPEGEHNTLLFETVDFDGFFWKTHCCFSRRFRGHFPENS